MRSLAIKLTVIGLAASGLAGCTQDIMAALAGKSSTSIKDVKPEAFVAPKGHMRVYFPGQPKQIDVTNSAFHNTLLPLPHYFVGDREVSFYAGEKELSGIEALSLTNSNSIDLSNRGITMDPDGNFNSPAGQQGNNDLVQRGQPNASNAGLVQKYLDDQCDLWVKSNGGSILRKLSVAAGGGAYPGRYAEGSLKDPGKAFRLKIFCDGQTRRIYSLCVTGQRDRVNSPQASKFLDHIDIWQ